MLSITGRERGRDAGFTLIELLVVVLIIAILAAIAVPVFVNQRRKAWKAQVESALKDASTAQETWIVRPFEFEYSSDSTGAELLAEGWRYSDYDVTINGIWGNRLGYCIDVVSNHDPNIRGEYSSSDGRPLLVLDGSDPGASAVEGAVMGSCGA